MEPSPPPLLRIEAFQGGLIGLGELSERAWASIGGGTALRIDDTLIALVVDHRTTFEHDQTDFGARIGGVSYVARLELAWTFDFGLRDDDEGLGLGYMGLGLDFRHNSRIAAAVGGFDWGFGPYVHWDLGRDLPGDSFVEHFTAAEIGFVFRLSYEIPID